MPLRIVLVLALGLLLGAAPARALDATCGMTVPSGETAVLQADLACADLQVAIRLAANATLDLNGHTLSVGEEVTGVYCEHVACSVVSSAATPGVIDGGFVGSYGLISNLQPTERPTIRKLVVDNVVIRDFEYVGMYAAFFGKSLLSRLTVSGCGGPGIIGKKMILSDVTVSGNGLDPQLSRDGIVASGAGGGSGKVTGANVTVSDNGGDGIVAQGPVKILGLTATGNADAGVEAHTVTLKDGTLTGNGVIDILSDRRPRLKTTACDHSNWGVCALD